MGGGHAPGPEEDILLRPLPPQDGHRHAPGLRARPAPRPQGARTAGRAEARGAGTRAGGDGRPRRPRVGTGLQRPEGASDSALLEPGAGGRAGGRPRTVAGRVRPASPGHLPELPRQRTSLLGPAGLAPFFRHPYPSGSSQPPPPSPFQGPGPLPRPRWRALSPTCADPGAGLEAHSGKKQGWGIYFFSPFLFFNKKN